MSKQKFEQAKKLIERKRYKEARRILESIDHPTAGRWLAKLDDMEFDKAVSKKPIFSLGYFVRLIAGAILLLAAIAGFLIIIDYVIEQRETPYSIDYHYEEMESTRQVRQTYEQLGVTPPAKSD